ncbi:hypothetical protein ACS0TY_013657 [Phlomoides rotata]
MKHTYIVRDILSIHVSIGSDSRVWAILSLVSLLPELLTIFFALLTPELTGLLGFGAILYPHVVRPSFGGLFRENSLLLIGFVSLATRFPFGQQLGYLWQTAFITTLWSIRHARNKAVFEEIQPSIQRCLAFITASIKETNQLALGHISGSVRELLILGRLGLSGRPPPPTSTMVIRWKPPKAGWYKVNVDGSAPSSPGPLFA